MKGYALIEQTLLSVRMGHLWTPSGTSKCGDTQTRIITWHTQTGSCWCKCP